MTNHNLRCGYTTGSCAAAAAKAAASCLIQGKEPGQVTLDLPRGERISWVPVRVSCEEEVFEKTEVAACAFRVQKDAGDDPDVTNGIWIYARVSPVPGEDFAGCPVSGKGYWIDGEPPVYLDGGCGIGVVTKKGLSCPPGHYALNPVPREMIARAVREVCADTGYRKPLLVSVAIPEGEKLAKKTFNPKLGIVGGISVLGTTGIVRPMSEAALLDTICLELHMNAVSGRDLVVMTPGNYGEIFLEEQMRIPPGIAVVCSNYVQDSVMMAVGEGIGKILFVGHIGKLIKVAAGMGNTHSRYGDRRMETIAEVIFRASGRTDSGLREKILACVTTDEALKLLVSEGKNQAQIVMDETAKAVKIQMEAWSDGKVSVETMVFSSAAGLIGCTEYAKEYRNQILKEAYV